MEVTLDALVEDKELPNRELPCMLAEEGYGAIEDWGGADGLKELAEAFRRKI